jgi:hypothetical protein
MAGAWLCSRCLSSLRSLPCLPPHRHSFTAYPNITRHRAGLPSFAQSPLQRI